MTGATWKLERAGGLVLVRCGALLDVPGVAHAFSTRIAEGGERFDLGASEARTQRFLAAAGLAGARPALLRQVHGNRVVRAATCGAQEHADAALWMRADGRGPVPSIRFADCVPILLVERRGRAAAAVHAGWRGTAAGVVACAVAALGENGIRPEDLIAALGPAILACCFTVGAEVAAAFPDAARVERAGAGAAWRVDLHAANLGQLVRAGVPAAAVHRAPWCTKCRGDLFFSHRREQAASGRMLAAVGPGPAP